MTSSWASPPLQGGEVIKQEPPTPRQGTVHVRVGRALPREALMFLLPDLPRLSAPLLRQHRQGRRRPEEHQVPVKSPVSAATPVQLTQRHLQPDGNSSCVSGLTQLLASLGQSGDIAQESDLRTDQPRHEHFNQTGKCAHCVLCWPRRSAPPAPLDPAHPLSRPLSSLSCMGVCHMCLPRGSLTQRQHRACHRGMSDRS